MRYKVLGLSGKAGSGKDFVYTNYLRPQSFFQVSLAWHFKADLIGKKVITFEEAFVTKPPKVRTMLQLVGTELGRNIYGDKVWCNILIAWMDIFHFHWGIDKFVIPDVRFQNELDFIQKDLDGLVFRIVAPYRAALMNMSPDQLVHASEAEMDTISDDKFDGVVFNDELHAQTLDLQLERLFAHHGWNYDTAI
jgi:hypothetical protein